MHYRKSSSSVAGSCCIEAAHQSWQTASYSFSNGNCVQAAGTPFAKAGASATGHCVEAAAAEFTSARASNYNGNCVEAGTAPFAKAGASVDTNCVEAGTVPFAPARASQPQAHCVEAGSAEFANAAECNGGTCVEHGDHGGMVFVRDSKDPRSATDSFPHLHFPRDQWDGGRAVHFEPLALGEMPPQEALDVAAARDHVREQRWYKVTSPSPQDAGTVLWFDQAEMDAWVSGVLAGEFALADRVAA